MSAKGSKRRLSSVLLALAIWLGLGLSAPVLVHLTSSTIPFPDAVVAAQSSSYVLARSVELVGAPLVRVERGTVSLSDANGKPVPNSSAEAILKGGTGTLVLDQGTVQIAGPTSNSNGEESTLPVAPLADALAKLRGETLMLRRSTVSVTLPSGNVETLTSVDAIVSLKRKGVAAIRGSGSLRGQRVTFDITSGLQVERRADATDSVPLRAQIKSALLEVSFDGRMGVSNRLQFDGHSEVMLLGVRRVAQWFGAYWPQGPGPNNVSIKGQLAWSNRSLTFDRASTNIDGNEASGAWELALSQPRPVLGGTLAFNSLNLSPLVRESNTSAVRGDGWWNSLLSTLFTVPLGGLLDADVRLSANRVLLDGADLGSSAATVSLRDGKLLADIAEMQVGNGRGAMQVRADLTSFRPRLSLRGKLDNVELGGLLKIADNRSVLQAPGTVVLDLTATGGTTADILRTASGRIMVKALDAGRVGLDLRRGLAMAAESDLEGWGTLSRGTTMFEAAEFKLIAREGVLFTEAAEIRNAEGIWAATGLINLAASRLDLRLTQVVAGQRAVSQPSVLELRGPWTHPTIRALPDPGSASAPETYPARSPGSAVRPPT